MNYTYQDVIFMNIAKEISKMSKCVSYKVGCILVKDKRIISTGYNGTPCGFQNCDEHFLNKDIENWRELHHQFSENYEIHAEMNAIIFAARHGISIEGADLYTTLHPCNNCLKNLCNCGIKNIFYSIKYDKFDNSELTDKLILNSKINLIKVN
jgi:dCMP deaminase